MSDVSVVITAHREGVLVAPGVKSALVAVDHARRCHSIECEIIVVLDRADPVTASTISNLLDGKAQILAVDLGDPGQSRNAGVDVARGKYIALLDADDLWSFNWLDRALSAASLENKVIWHSECNIVFGKEHNTWWHVDSDGDLYLPDYLTWANYWDALTFGEIGIYKKFPFRPNDLAAGYGHEDWDWNRITTAAGIHHKAVPGTVHFKRRRTESQMSRVWQSDAIVRPS